MTGRGHDERNCRSALPRILPGSWLAIQSGASSVGPSGTRWRQQCRLVFLPTAKVRRRSAFA